MVRTTGVRRTKLGESCYLTSNYILQGRSNHGTCINTDIQITQSPEINPCLYGQLILTCEARTYHGVKMVYSVNGVRKIGQICAEK